MQHGLPDHKEHETNHNNIMQTTTDEVLVHGRGNSSGSIVQRRWLAGCERRTKGSKRRVCVHASATSLPSTSAVSTFQLNPPRCR
jgi:hypothetical protein